MSRAKASGSLGGIILAILIMMFPTQFISILSTFADIFAKWISSALIKALGI